MRRVSAAVDIRMGLVEGRKLAHSNISGLRFLILNLLLELLAPLFRHRLDLERPLYAYLLQFGDPARQRTCLLSDFLGLVRCKICGPNCVCR